MVSAANLRLAPEFRQTASNYRMASDTNGFLVHRRTATEYAVPCLAASLYDHHGRRGEDGVNFGHMLTVLLHEHWFEVLFTPARWLWHAETFVPRAVNSALVWPVNHTPLGRVRAHSYAGFLWEQALAMVIVFVAVLLEWLAVLVCAVFWLFAVFMAYIYLPCAGIWALYRWLADR